MKLSSLWNWIPELWHTMWIWVGRWFVDREKEKRRDDWRERWQKQREERQKKRRERREDR